MYYYYVRYNVYSNGSAPEQKEAWFKFPEHHDESGIKRFLTAKHNSGITIINSVGIDEDQYHLREIERY